jgi:signal transduction histidine kinase
MDIPPSEPEQTASTLPVTDPVTGKELPAVVAALRERIADGDIVGNVLRFRRNEFIIKEGSQNDAIYLILEGRVHLTKQYGEEPSVPVGTLEAGDFVGLISFYSEDRAISSVQAKTDVTTLRFGRDEFDRLHATEPELAALVQPLITRNLAERYRRMLLLHLEVAALTREIEGERNRLQEALDELQSTRNRLIHQEKMAILGQLVAGIAHELNNPASAMLRGAENLAMLLPETVDPESAEIELLLLNLGLNRVVLGTEEQRQRMEVLGKKFPRVQRSDVRTLAQIPEEGIAALAPHLAVSSAEGKARMATLLRWFEIGVFLRNIQVSGNRISSIVQSLRGYSRESKAEIEAVDIGQGIQDTLLMVANRLKNVTVQLELAPLPKVRCRPGEMNQVWTNLILNACDAMKDRGTLWVKTEMRGSDEVTITIADSGPGIPPDILPRIFEANFTTKTASGSFGLGLGLAISREIVHKHGGSIAFHNAPGRGAVCTVVLPLESSASPSSEYQA